MIDPEKYGVSLSVKQCRNFKIDHIETLGWLIEKGFRRFRLMSYWDEIEKQDGKFDYKYLDEQLKLAKKSGSKVTLCLGVKQPRWPEYHWPAWAWEMDKPERDEKLYRFLKKTVKRYKKYDHIISYQLENEALLKKFGWRIEIDRERLINEYALVKSIDPKTPVIMTTCNTFGVPVFGPIPDKVGFSLYLKSYNSRTGTYRSGFQRPITDKIRRWLIRLSSRKDVLIHELQLEPWGPKDIWEMNIAEQNESMDIKQIRKNIKMAKKCQMNPIDLWGGEWWHYREKVLNDKLLWQEIRDSLKAT